MSRKQQGDPLTEEEVMSALPANGDVGTNFSAKRITELINLGRQASGREPVKQGHVQIVLQAMASAVPPRVGLLEGKPHLYYQIATEQRGDQPVPTVPPVAKPVSMPVAKPASEVSAPIPIAVQSHIKLVTDVHLAENYLLPDERMPWDDLVTKSEQELHALLEAAKKRKGEIQALVDPVHQELATKKTELALSNERAESLQGCWDEATQKLEVALSDARGAHEELAKIRQENTRLQKELSEEQGLVVQLRAECEGFAAKITELESFDPNDVVITLTPEAEEAHKVGVFRGRFIPKAELAREAADAAADAELLPDFSISDGEYKPEGDDYEEPFSDPLSEPVKPEEKPELVNWAIVAIVIIVCAVVGWKVWSV